MARFLILALYDYADVHGGAPKLAYEQAEFLHNQGHEVWLLAQDPTTHHSSTISTGISTRIHA
ncbi:MAG: hypothetical protein MUE54_07230 [Anaerolineae bacterium]|nr:hypothetical protein [Anaerolineae bacterium]